MKPSPSVKASLVHFSEDCHSAECHYNIFNGTNKCKHNFDRNIFQISFLKVVSLRRSECTTRGKYFKH